MSGVIRQLWEDPERRTPCDDRGRDWSAAAGSQGMPRIASHNRKLGTGQEGLSSTSSQGAWPSSYLDVRLLASRTVTLQVCVVSSHSVYGTLWGSPRKHTCSNQGKEEGQPEAKGKKEELLCWVGSLMLLVLIFYWNDLESFIWPPWKKNHEGTPSVRLFKI